MMGTYGGKIHEKITRGKIEILKEHKFGCYFFCNKDKSKLYGLYLINRERDCLQRVVKSTGLRHQLSLLVVIENDFHNSAGWLSPAQGTGRVI